MQVGGVQLHNEVSFFPVMMLFCLTMITGVQQYNMRFQTAKGRLAPNSMGIEGIEIEQGRGLPFISRRFGRNRDPDPDQNSPRGFNNPNIKFTIKFKDKVKNNNYEFIVTIERDLAEDEEEVKTNVIKQYKVKRNLYEFQEIFNFLETKNPRD